MQKLVVIRLTLFTHNISVFSPEDNIINRVRGGRLSPLKLLIQFNLTAFLASLILIGDIFNNSPLTDGVCIGAYDDGEKETLYWFVQTG